MIAFFGTGLLGSAFIRALCARGEVVHVWNRSPEKARALEQYGAKVFEYPADAAMGASRVHLTLSDDAAVDAVLERTRPGLHPGAIIVDHTTTSPDGAVARVKRWAERDVAFQHAPVFMAPANALERKGLMMLSGDKALYDRLSPDLSKMTGKLIYLGPEVAKAASFKLMGNLFLMFVTEGLVEVLELAKSLGVPRADACTLFDWFNPGPTIPARVKRMVEADYSHPSWELVMARKDARLMLEAASRGGVSLSALPNIAQNMDRWIQRGHAHDDWTVMAKDAL